MIVLPKLLENLKEVYNVHNRFLINDVKSTIKHDNYISISYSTLNSNRHSP